MTDRLSVIRHGSGPPLVLVHGYFGGAGHWRGEMRALSDTHEIIAPALAGFGESAGVMAPDTIAGNAELVWQALDAEGIDRIALLGHSMGGMVVQEMIAQCPARVERLILYGTGPVGLLPGRFETLDQSRARIAEDGLDATLRRIAATWFVDGEAAPGFRTCLEVGAMATEQAALAALRAWETWDGRASLPRITVPTLVVWGDLDRSYPRSQIDTLLNGIPDARLALFRGCAHAVHLESPPCFHATLRDFLTPQASP